MIILVVLIVTVLVVLALYIVREAAVLKTTASALQDELRQFKEGGFDKLVDEKLNRLTKEAVEQLQAREKLIKEQQETATAAARKFQQDLGAMSTKIDNLKDLGVKVSELNDLLKPQQLRGELGEVIVRTLISDKLPPSQYEEDHAFSNGKKVEFAIRLNDRLIPVDSKLQLEDFKRLREIDDERERQVLRSEFKRKVKQKIDEVKQYIRPEEGTYNFALMVIPSEAVYYELIANKEFTDQGGLYEYARTNNVFLVSPLTFWAYLTAIAQGLQGLEVGRRAEEILASLQTFAASIRDLLGERGDFKVLGDHLRNAMGKYDEARDTLQEVDKDLKSLERLPTNQLTERSVAA